MNDKDVVDGVTTSITEEERRNERRIHLARISIFSLVLIMMSVSRLMLGEALNARFVLVSLFSALCIGIGILLWRYYQDHRHSAVAKYLLVTLDVTFVFILVLIVRYTMSRHIYEVTSDIPAFLVLFVINAMSGLRFDFKLSAYSAAASIAVLTGLTIYDFHTHTMSHPYLVVTSLFKGVMLVGVALISGYIGSSAKRLLIHDHKEQREKSYVKDLFGKYVTPEIRDSILADRIPLNGERTEATVLIADLRDFTPYVEANDPEEVVSSDDFSETWSKCGPETGKCKRDTIHNLLRRAVTKGMDGQGVIQRRDVGRDYIRAWRPFVRLQGRNPGQGCQGLEGS